MLAQAAAAETRIKDLKSKGWSTEAQLEQVKATADEARVLFAKEDPALVILDADDGPDGYAAAKAIKSIPVGRVPYGALLVE